MRFVSCVLVMTAIAASTSMVLTQRGVAATPDAHAERDVLTTDNRRTEALRKGDAAALNAIYAADYSLITPAGVIQTKADQIADLTSGALRYLKIEVAERTVRVYGDTAIVVSRETTDIVRNNEQVGGDIRVSRTYKKIGSHWYVIATHASAIGQ
jgi:hypothetical protein